MRYYAGAAEAAGCEGETLVVAAGTVGDLRAAMVAAHGPPFAQVLARCSLLVAGLRAPDAGGVPDGAVVDVLPPFAGG